MQKSSAAFRVNHLPPFLLGELAASVIAARTSGRDVIDLSQLNPSLGPPGAAVEKLVQASLQPHNHKYSSSQGITKLRSSMCQWYERRFEVSLDPEREVVVTMGSKEGLSHLLFAVASPGDAVLLPSPAYPIHVASIALAGANCIAVSLPDVQSNGGVLTEQSDELFERLTAAYEAAWPRPIMMVLSFPHNPTATVVTLGFFERLVGLAREKGFYLAHDFAYADVCFDGYRTPSILQARGARDVAVEFCSLSKGMSMPGWRIGVCAGNEALVSALKKIKSYLDCGAFQPLQIAAIKAFDSYDQTIHEAVDIYRARRDVLASGLAQLGFELNVPKGSLFLWARIPEKFRGAGSFAFCRMLLEQANVAACPGSGFDSHADDYVRFALVEPEARLRTAIAKLEQVLKS
ncbi:MAG: aminotransferase class I/II-fold pyridoxal phosphate-dependent enzyme [Bdellovibrionota bacterium]